MSKTVALWSSPDPASEYSFVLADDDARLETASPDYWLHYRTWREPHRSHEVGPGVLPYQYLRDARLGSLRQRAVVGSLK